MTRNASVAPDLPRVELLADGVLAESIADALDGIARVERHRGPGAPPPELVVDAADSWLTVDETAIADCPHLTVRVEIGQAVVGPLELPGESGCAGCLDLRRHRARENPERREALVAQYGDELARRRSGWLTRLAGDTIGALVADEYARLRDTSEVPHTMSAAYLVDLPTLSVDRHTFIPDPLCPHCGNVPRDSRELAEIRLQARPKPDSTTHRMRDLTEQADQLVDTYVDPACGMVSSLVSGTHGGVAVSIASLRCRPHDALEPGFGRATNFRDARLTAVLEALERFGGAAPGGRHPAVVASYDQVADEAIDPRAFGPHAAESYRQPEFMFRPFAPSTPARWVWGHSFGRGEPVLVPEGAAYWHTHPEWELRPFFFEISSGCALGSCLEEAILYGILEVVERDAFLMTWYANYAAPQIDLRNAQRDIRLLSSVISSDTGCDIMAFDTTMEHGIPSVWVMAVHPDDRHDTAKIVCAAGAHLEPEKALRTALHELGPARASLDGTFPGEAARAREMLRDPRNVRAMSDHSVLYGAHEAFARLYFLTQSPPARSLADMAAAVDGDWYGTDLTHDLQNVIRRLAECGLDVIVVDQTTPEHRVAGLVCVKVLVPGTLSMTFGHQHRRTEGITRLDTVPDLLATRAGVPARANSGLNPHPHPFP